MSKFKIGGIKIDCINYQQTLETIQKFIKSKKPHQIVTVNPEFVVTAQKDREFRKILNQAELSLPDGIGIVLASRLFRQSIKEKVTGIDLIPKIAQMAKEGGYSIYFLGAEEGVAARTASILKKNCPKLKIAGTESGSPHSPFLIEKIKKAKPDILFVAFGHPKQEKWISKYKKRLGVPVAIGVGGAFDFIAQKVPRAPLWTQRVGLEWLYRLIKEPWRWKRQIKLLVFVYLVFKQLIKDKS